MRLRIILGILALLGASSSATWASPNSTSEKVLGQGLSEWKKGHVKEALELFQKSQAMSPSSRTILYIAGCEEKLGQVLSPLRRYQALLASNESTWRYAAYVKREIALLESKVARVVLSFEGQPAGLEVRIDEQIIPAPSQAPIAIDPGARSLRVSAPGYEEEIRVFHVDAGQTRRLSPISMRKIRKPNTKPPWKPLGAVNWGATLLSAGGIFVGVGGALMFTGYSSRKEGETVYEQGANTTLFGRTNTTWALNGKWLADGGEREFNQGLVVSGFGLAVATVGATLMFKRAKESRGERIGVFVDMTKSRSGLIVSYTF